MEVETQILIAVRLGYLSEHDAKQITERSAEVGRLINGLSNSLNNKLPEERITK
jgi:four helix bundle protein